MEETKEDKRDYYRSLVEKKERLTKEKNEAWFNYLKFFGEAKIDAYRLQILSIELKKRISFCQKLVNEGLPINEEEMNKYIEGILDEYESNLEFLKRDKVLSGKGTPITYIDANELKKLFRKLVKLMHPDLHPQFYKDEEANELWDRIQNAYQRNDLDALRDLEMLVMDFVSKHGEQAEDDDIPNIDQRINKLEMTILHITTTEPYTLRRILANKESMEQEKERLEKTIDEYEGYVQELTEKLKTFNVSSKTRMDRIKKNNLWKNWPY